MTTRPSIRAGRPCGRPAAPPRRHRDPRSGRDGGAARRAPCRCRPGTGAAPGPGAARARRRVGEPVPRRLAHRSRPHPADRAPAGESARVLRSGSLGLRRPASPRRAGRLRPRPPHRAPLHGRDRRDERQPAQRVPGPSRRGAARAHGRGPPRLGSGHPHPPRTSRESPRAGDPLRARGDPRPARLGRPARRAVAGLRDGPSSGGGGRAAGPPWRRSIARPSVCSAARSIAAASARIGSPSPPSSPPAASRHSSSRPATRSTGNRPPRRS